MMATFTAIQPPVELPDPTDIERGKLFNIGYAFRVPAKARGTNGRTSNNS
jgi:hypothetical protein